MSNEQENKKLNKLDIKKETITDLNVANSEDVIGGGGHKTNEYPACGCARSGSCPATVTKPIELPKSNYCGGPA